MDDVRFEFTYRVVLFGCEYSKNLSFGWEYLVFLFAFSVFLGYLYRKYKRR